MALGIAFGIAHSRTYRYGDPSLTTCVYTCREAEELHRKCRCNNHNQPEACASRSRGNAATGTCSSFGGCAIPHDSLKNRPREGKKRKNRLSIRADPWRSLVICSSVVARSPRCISQCPRHVREISPNNQNVYRNSRRCEILRRRVAKRKSI